MVCTWLSEICSCSRLTFLPRSAWALLNKIYKPFFSILYLSYHSLPNHVRSDSEYVETVGY